MKKVRTTDFQKMKDLGEKIAMVTAYDAAVASIVDGAGVDVVLVGDSLGNVVQGLHNTLSVTLEEMIYHTENRLKRGKEGSPVLRHAVSLLSCFR